jgi:hypothetical protein
MSKHSLETVACPMCGNKEKITIWDSLNSELSPDAKQKLLDGELFRFTCSKCGNSTGVFYPCLYHDMTHNVMIYLVDEQHVEETKKVMDYVENHMTDIAKASVPSGLKIEVPDLGGRRKRIVTEQNSLREKAIIFDNNLDDRVIEIIKWLYYVSVYEQHPDINEIYFFAEDGKFKLQFIGNMMWSVDVQEGLYEKIKEQYKERLDSVDKEYCVDKYWAAKMVI